MEQIDQRYLVQQNKISDGETKPPVFAKVMRSKEGVFEAFPLSSLRKRPR